MYLRVRRRALPARGHAFTAIRCLSRAAKEIAAVDVQVIGHHASSVTVGGWPINCVAETSVPLSRDCYPKDLPERDHATILANEIEFRRSQNYRRAPRVALDEPF